MKVTVKDIYNHIDKAAPFDTSMSFDNTGILVGDKNAEVKKALVALDISIPVVEEAKKIGADLIISHHPIIFNPARKVVKGTALYELAVSGMSAICCHTNLDVSMVCGVNKSLSEVLGMEKFERDENSECMFTAEFEEPVKASDFAELLKIKLNAPYTVYTRGTGDKLIKKVGFCSGSGGEFVFDAIGSCDAYLTGEAKHHELLFAFENNFPMFTAGHYATEKIFDRAFIAYLKEEFPEIEFVISEEDCDPVTV
ncbi:MAG: Nif3-like dinuclear metal center hexameric protein [Clostridia bacterium]|nr:Nif3-like dinuclear metal center hexameric protein [Clostridia bacterium]